MFSLLEPSLGCQQIIGKRVFWRLRTAWYAAAEINEEDNILVTNERQSILSQNRQKIYLNKQSDPEKFYLLITPCSSALLCGRLDLLAEQYLAEIIFDRQIIKTYLQKLNKASRKKFALIQDLENRVTNKFKLSSDRLQELAIETVSLLSSENCST